ncbi:MAG: alpha/beta fold hydrolase [Dehalococcoidia bacterium]
MPHVITNGIATYYQDTGHGPPLVFIHGHSLDHRMWEPQVAPLVNSGYRVIRYDTRGHGQSEAPASGYTWQHYALDLRDLLDRLGLDTPAHVVGLSMGGGIALQFALDHPQRVASLVLVDSTVPGFTYSPEFSQMIEELREAIRSEGPRAALERLWLPHPLFDGIRRFPDRFQSLKSIVLAYPAQDYIDDTEYPQPQWQVIDRLAEIRAPTLVLVGEDDLPDFRLIADILAANIATARLEVIADAGHLLNLEQPEAFNQALLRFLATLAQGRP